MHVNAENSPIRIQRKRDIAHLPIRQPLLKRHAHPLQPRARLLNIGHRHRNVSKPAPRVGVSRRVVEVGIRLGAVVVRELEDALARAPGGFFVLGGGGPGGVVEGEEVEREVAVAVLCGG